MGVRSTTVGYTGGNNPRPSYKSVCQGDGHSEAIQIEYDPEQLSYDELLDNFFAMHFPSGPFPAQYKSAIWFHSEEQKKVAERVLKKQTQRDADMAKYVGLAPIGTFHDAEEYHQKYYQKKSQGLGHWLSGGDSL